MITMESHTIQNPSLCVKCSYLVLHALDQRGQVVVDVVPGANLTELQNKSMLSRAVTSFGSVIRLFES